MVEEGLGSIRDVRNRYDGRRRSPYDEAECGHHYARAMAAWGAVLALTGFRYSGVEKRMTLAAKPGDHFWSSGYAWGSCSVELAGEEARVNLSVVEGSLPLAHFHLAGFEEQAFPEHQVVTAGNKINFTTNR